MARYPFNYRYEDAVAAWYFWEEHRKNGRATLNDKLIAESRNADGSLAFRVIKGSEDGTFAVYAPGWDVNRHDTERLRFEAIKQMKAAERQDFESKQIGREANAVKFLNHKNSIMGELSPVSYPRQLSTDGRTLETYIFMLDGKMDDGTHNCLTWRNFLLKCKDYQAITLGDLYDVVSKGNNNECQEIQLSTYRF